MQSSFWEKDSFLQPAHLTIIGSGIVGLSAAFFYKHKHPESRVVLLERGMLPMGASTRNAGFACFGSVTELLDDVAENGKEAMIRLVTKRYQGLQLLRQELGDKNIDYNAFGGYEVFLKEDTERFNKCAKQLTNLNQLLTPIFSANAFTTVDLPSSLSRDKFLPKAFYTPFEGQLHAGKMVKTLLNKAHKEGVTIYNGADVVAFTENETDVTIELQNGSIIKTNELLMATNGFSKDFFPELDILPARNQVLITKPIKGLTLKGNFHYNSGYVYFRNVGNRILLGGGRNIDKPGEQTAAFAKNNAVQQYLKDFLTSSFTKVPEEASWWSGIMGVGQEKYPIIKKISPRITAAIRLGGMGVAIGMQTGRDAVELI